MELTLSMTEQKSLVALKTVYVTNMAKKFTQMEEFILVNFKMMLKTAKVFLFGEVEKSQVFGKTLN